MGAVVGLATFGVTQVTGRNLFLTTGALAGVIAVLVLQVYGRSARLTQTAARAGA